MLGTSVALLALAAIVLGLAVGATVPAIVGRAAADLLPVAPDPTPQWGALMPVGGLRVAGHAGRGLGARSPEPLAPGPPRCCAATWTKAAPTAATSSFRCWPARASRRSPS